MENFLTIAKGCNHVIENDGESLFIHFGDIPNNMVKEFVRNIEESLTKKVYLGKAHILITAGIDTTLISVLYFPSLNKLKIDYI